MKSVTSKLFRYFFMAFLIIIIMPFFTVPMTANAATKAHTAHKGTDKDGSKHSGWTAINNEEELREFVENGGSGYLTGDIVISNSCLNVSGEKEVNLCLNGHKITQTSSYSVFFLDGSTSKLNLFDEKGNKGMITHNSDIGCGLSVINGATFVMNGGTISGNEADNGGGVEVNCSTFIMNGGCISQNKTTVGSGAGIYAYQSEVTMNGGTISNNVSGSDGGAVFCNNYANFTMNGGTISNNTCNKGAGGAINLYDSSFTMNGGTISKNESFYAGAGISAFRSDVIIKDGNIEGNYCSDNVGGALYAFGEKVIIDGGVFSDNISKKFGGAISLQRVTGYINGGSFTGNFSEDGGGAIYSERSTLTMTGGIINGNGTNGYGGGIYSNDTHLTMSGVTITENTALNGGGMTLTNTYYEIPPFSIEGITVKDNHAENNGESLFINTSGLIIGGTIKGSIYMDTETFRSTKYLPNSGTGDAYTQYYRKYSGETLTENRFTRSGFKFYNWNTKADGSGKTYKAGENVTESTPAKLYAQWKPTKYTVKFNANGGTGTMTSQSIKYNTSTTLNQNTFTKNGYVFKGWNTKADGSGTSYADAAKVTLKTLNVNKITLYAQWELPIVAYKVEHYRQKVDGSYNTTPNDTESLTGKINASVTPEVKTYKGFTAPATQTAKIKADGALVIKYYYTRNSYKLTWDFAGGKASGSYTKGTVKYGSKITAPVPVKDGYVFDGWDKTVPDKMPANDVTYKAKWRKPTNEEQVRNFVGRFYTIILERPAEEAGLNDWTGRLLRKEATGAQVAAGFINSDEFQKKKMTDEEYVTKLYRAFFDREPDQGGYEGWLRELKNGKSRDYVLRGFIGSPEFDNLCKKYGINTGSY